MDGRTADPSIHFGQHPAADEDELCLGCWHDAPLSDEDAAYADYLSRLLHSPLYMLSELVDGNDELLSLTAVKEVGLDLLLYWEEKRRWWQQLLGVSPACSLVERISSNVLVINRPRCPLRRILLILRANHADDSAVAWLKRLAVPAQAEVFILPIIPPIPALYQYGSIPLQEEVLLANSTCCGARLRQLLTMCALWGIRETLLVDSREPQRRIEWAVTAYDCDLIVISGEPNHWLYRKMAGELVRPLLNKSKRPVLIANSRPAEHETDGI